MAFCWSSDSLLPDLLLRYFQIVIELLFNQLSEFHGISGSFYF